MGTSMKLAAAVHYDGDGAWAAAVSGKVRTKTEQVSSPNCVRPWSGCAIFAINAFHSSKVIGLVH